jgi:FkbM family methyltransferase
MNVIKSSIHHLFNQLGFDIVRHPPRRMGEDPFRDMQEFLQGVSRPLVFDVGANEGQSVDIFKRHFPASTIHSFEPSEDTYLKLRDRTSSIAGVSTWNCALGSAVGSKALHENTRPKMSSFLELGSGGWGKIQKTSVVDVTTIDQFCRDKGIDRIDVLKSDTQGYDLEVFKGAAEMMRRNKISLIFCELILCDKMYQGIPRFDETLGFLRDRGFSLVAFYKFHFQDKLGSWTDALLINKDFHSRCVGQNGDGNGRG